jgi:tetratricopeptide (TPR) repeat protein
MNVVVFAKRAVRNKYIETIFFGLLFVWIAWTTISRIIDIFKQEAFTAHIIFLAFLIICLTAFLFYLFMDSYMRNFGLKAQADKAYKNGDYKLAIKKFTALLKIFRWNGHYYSDRGNCYYKMKNWKMAIDDYSRAIKYEPDSAYIYENRANAYKFSGFITHAKKDFSKAKSLKNKN